MWPVGSDAWQPLIIDDNGRRIKLPVGQPPVALSADNKNSEGAAAAACTASHISLLRAEAPEFVPTTGFLTDGETDYNVDSVLDHLWIPPCDAQFGGAPGLMRGAPGLTRDAAMCHHQSPVLNHCSIQPEVHMVALAKATQYARNRSRQATSQSSTGLMPFDPLETTYATHVNEATEVVGARCEQQPQERIPVAEEQPTNGATPEKPCAADVTSRSFRFVTAATLASAFATGFLLASSLGLTSQSVVSSGLAVCQAVSRP